MEWFRYDAPTAVVQAVAEDADGVGGLDRRQYSDLSHFHICGCLRPVPTRSAA